MKSFTLTEKEQIRVYLYDDFCDNSLGVVRDIFSFLGVTDSFVPNRSKTYNMSQIPKHKAIHELITKPNLLKSILKPLLPKKLRQHLKANLRQQNMIKPKLSRDIRCKLLEEYRDDILKLQDLIQKNLS